MNEPIHSRLDCLMSECLCAHVCCRNRRQKLEQRENLSHTFDLDDWTQSFSHWFSAMKKKIVLMQSRWLCRKKFISILMSNIRNRRQEDYKHSSYCVKLVTDRLLIIDYVVNQQTKTFYRRRIVSRFFSSFISWIHYSYWIFYVN